MEADKVTCLEPRSKSGIAADMDHQSAQLVLCFCGTTAPSLPSHTDCHPVDSTSVAGVPGGLVFPLVSACTQHFGKETCLAGRRIRSLRDLNIKHAPLAGAFMTRRDSEGKMTLIGNKPLPCVLRSELR